MANVEPNRPVPDVGAWLSGPMIDGAADHPAEPIDPPDEFEGNPIIGYAVHSVRAFAGEDAPRETCTTVLRFWRYYGQLTVRERAAVLLRFPSSR